MLTTVATPEKTTISELKAEALNALKSDVLSSDHDGDINMLSGALPPDPDWIVPTVESIEDFELARAVKERGRPTGQYETLQGKDVVKQTVTNWESLFIQFRDERGEWLVFSRGDVYPCCAYPFRMNIHLCAQSLMQIS